jgi:hypothetical protein
MVNYDLKKICAKSVWRVEKNNKIFINQIPVETNQVKRQLIITSSTTTQEVCREYENIG